MKRGESTSPKTAVESWTKKLYVDAATGVIDIVLNPARIRRFLYAASYQKGPSSLDL